MSDLIEYYRAGAECHPICKYRDTYCPCTETADTIERLTAERDRQYDQNVEQITQIASLQDELETLDQIISNYLDNGGE